MRFEFFLAKRFLTGQRFGVFRAITTTIAIAGTALGVAALLITLAVMDGFRTDIQEKILGTEPHVEIIEPFGHNLPYEPALVESLHSIPHIEAASPFIRAQALLQHGNQVTGILLRGVIPATETQVTPVGQILSQGKWSDLDDHHIVLGQELANSLSARVGGAITLIVPQGDRLSLTQTPRMRAYTVSGIFHSGMYERDANMAYVTLAAAQDLVGMSSQITGYGLRLDDLDATERVEALLQDRLGLQYWVRSWEDLYKPLFKAMKLERLIMFLILTLIILVSSFTIISNLLLLTIEKAREIGILQALGASPRQIGIIFLYHGLILGGSGVGIGLVLGTGISALLKRYRFIHLPADVYNIDRVPIHLSIQAIISVAACAFLLVLLSILYPAWKARELDPVQAIRYG